MQVEQTQAWFFVGRLQRHHFRLREDDVSDNAEGIRRDFSTHDGSFLSMYRSAVVNNF